jgi:UDP-N-acetylglucosamine 3-dehydrogenase
VGLDGRPGFVPFSRLQVASAPTVRTLHGVALLGLGAMGRRHARVLAALPSRFRIVGAYDVDPGAALPSGIERLASEAEAIARAELVIVATPVDAHAGSVARALAAGRQVLVEKPVCARGDEALSLALRARPDARLFVGHSERFNPVIRALARLLRRDPALTIELTRVGPSSGRPGPSGASPGVLLNLGVHDLDLAAYLGRGEVSLRATRAPVVDPARLVGADDAAHVLFEATSGVTGSIYVDRKASAKRRTVRLATARWIYEGDLVAHRLKRTARSTGRASEVPLAHEEPLVAQAIALADALEGRPAASRELADGFDGARAVALAERAALAAGHASDAALGPHAQAENLSLLGSP